MKRNGSVLIVLCVIVLLVLLAIGALYFYNAILRPFLYKAQENKPTQIVSVPIMVQLVETPQQRNAQNVIYQETNYATNSPEYHQWVTTSTPNNPYNAPKAQIDAAINWFVAHGMNPDPPDQYGFSLGFAATPDQLWSAFKVRVDSECGATKFQVPSELSSVVEIISMYPCAIPG